MLLMRSICASASGFAGAYNLTKSRRVLAPVVNGVRQMLTTKFRVWLQDPSITPVWTGVKVRGDAHECELVQYQQPSERVELRRGGQPDEPGEPRQQFKSTTWAE